MTLPALRTASQLTSATELAADGDVRVIRTAPAKELVAARLPFVDFVRGIAALFIVAHHLAFYGPLSDIAYPLAPAALDWLYEYARMAVQAFLVIGGFGMARRLARLPVLTAREIGRELWVRYRRVGLPYLAALVLAIVCNEVARQWMTHPSISAPPTLAQLLAHAAFLTHILGYEPLTVGVWYLAIDFQLVALCLLLRAVSDWIAKRRGASREQSWRIFFGLSSVLAVSSLFWLNRLTHLDRWAVYFFGSYFAGMLLEWALRGRVPRWALWSYIAVAALALTHEFRARLLVALAVTVLLSWAATGGVLTGWPRSRLALGLGKISYSLFLVHFPVCLVVNAWGSHHLAHSPAVALCAMTVAFALSIVAAIVFHRMVEARCLSRASSPAPSK